MAVVTYVFRYDDLEQAVLVELEGVNRDEVLRQGVNVKERIQALVRQRAEVNTPGGLADSIHGEGPYDDGDNRWSAIIVSDLDHAVWFEEGTGLFGPRKSWIFPRHEKLMSFVPRGQTRRIFAARVQGQPGKHPFRDGLNQAVGAGGPLRRRTF